MSIKLRHLLVLASAVLSWSSMGCGGAASDSSLTDADFFAQYTKQECELLSTCDADSFAERFDDEEDCLERLNQADSCEVADVEQAELCLEIMSTLSCDAIKTDPYLTSLLNCTEAIQCGGLN